MNRRRFIQNTAALVAAGSLLQRCNRVQQYSIPGGMVGPNATIGHSIRDASRNHSSPSYIIETEILIIGGGVSGLSAARWLQQNSTAAFLLVELENETGGNSASGKNDLTAYPWGAHYVPLPNNDLKEYLVFLHEANVITGFENELPIYNEFHVCFAPQERLYINGRWQEGIIPSFGLSDVDKKEVARFLDAMEVFRSAKGSDQLPAFNIPVQNSSKDVAYLSLDLMNMKAWLLAQQYVSVYLHWYVDYCCKDDFGADYEKVSAWAGIHYFAARKGKAANVPSQSVLTWPEGNAWLVQQLRKELTTHIQTNTAAYNIQIKENAVQVTVMDTRTKMLKQINAKKCIVATPQFVNSRMLPQYPERAKIIKNIFRYQPWMVANIQVRDVEERNGAETSWDNVLYKSKALGYVCATHQALHKKPGQQQFTYYMPLSTYEATHERITASKMTYEDWVSLIVSDLKIVHPNIESNIIQLDVWLWGHGMISPAPGFIHNPHLQKVKAPIEDKIFFAHSDLGGISIFEEAFYQGMYAAQQLMKTL